MRLGQRSSRSTCFEPDPNRRRRNYGVIVRQLNDSVNVNRLSPRAVKYRFLSSSATSNHLINVIKPRHRSYRYSKYFAILKNRILFFPLGDPSLRRRSVIKIYYYLVLMFIFFYTMNGRIYFFICSESFKAIKYMNAIMPSNIESINIVGHLNNFSSITFVRIYMKQRLQLRGFLEY